MKGEFINRKIDELIKVT